MENSSGSSSEFVQYRSIYGDDGGNFEHLLIYGNVRYHLLLEFNTAEPDCLENAALETMYDAVKRDDDHAQCATDKVSGHLVVIHGTRLHVKIKVNAKYKRHYQTTSLDHERRLRATNHNIDRQFSRHKISR